MTKNKGGRPPIGPLIRFRVDARVSEEARKAAAKRRMTLAEWMRQALEREIQRERTASNMGID